MKSTKRYLFFVVALLINGLAGTCCLAVELEAEIIDVRQLHSNYGFKYDGRTPIQLSGMTRYSEALFIIGDKRVDYYLYEIKETETHWRIVNRIKLENLTAPSLEGVSLHKERLFLLDEENTRVDYYFLKANVASHKSTIALSFSQDIYRSGVRNYGFEGIAFDPRKRHLYLAKERQPRAILKIQLNEDFQKGNIKSSFNIETLSLSESPESFSDIYYENGHLYVLERRDYLVSKIELETNSVVAQLNFANLKDKNGGLFEKETTYGFAEASLLTQKEIFIGLDNNGEDVEVQNRWVKKYGLRGNQPAIVKIVRPEGF